MMNRNAILNGKQNLWEIAEVAVYDACNQPDGFAKGARFQLHDWAPEPAAGSAELFILWVETDRTPMRIAFTRQQIEAFSHPTRAERLAMKSMLLSCLQRLVTGEDTLVRVADSAPPVGSSPQRIL
jgi:hypothetical protein